MAGYAPVQVKLSTGPLVDALLELVTSGDGIRILLVVFAIGVLYLFIKWVMDRSSTLYEEHDQLRKSLSEDRALLRDEVKSLLDELEDSRKELKEKDALVNSLRKIELEYLFKIKSSENTDITKKN